MNKINLIISMAILMAACSQPQETYVVEEREINEAVYAPGQIMPDEYYFLEVNAPDRLMNLLVEEGAIVEEGNILAVLGTPSENRQLDILSRQVALAREMAGDQSAVLAELQTRTQLARERYQQDSINAARYEALAGERAVSVREAEQARMQAQSSRSEYMSLKQQYASRRNELKANALQAEQQLAQLQKSREGRVLQSPMKGKVFGVFQRQGSLVQPGEPVVLVGSPDKFRLELLVDERDIRRVKLGQKIYFETDLHPERQFEARLTKIVPVVQRDTRSFEIEGEVLANDAILYPQSSVEANIVVREGAKVLVVPTDYVLAGDSVWIKQGDQAQKAPIRTGARDDKWVEVREGLNKGDILVKVE
jgi:HlyD family secretion protein